MANKNICFLASNASRPLKLAKMAKISHTWQPRILGELGTAVPLAPY